MTHSLLITQTTVLHCTSILSFLHKHMLNIFVSIYRVILTGGGGSFTDPGSVASRLSFALWTWLKRFSLLTEQSWFLHYYLGQKPSFLYHFSFLFKSWHTANSHTHWVVGVNCSSHMSGQCCTDIFTLSKKKSCAYTHTECVAETAYFYLHRPYDHHSYYHKPYLNEITDIINHLSTYIYLSPFLLSS